MSLKDLVKQAQRSKIHGGATAPSNGSQNKAQNRPLGGKTGTPTQPLEIEQISTPTGPITAPFLSASYGLFSDQMTDTQLIELLESFTQKLKAGATEGDRKEMIMWFFRMAFLQGPRARGCFHPSEISTETTWCLRKMYFQKADAPVDKTYIKFTADNRMLRLVELGTMVHLYIQDNLQRAGILKDFEVKVSRPELGIEGSTDGIVTFSGYDDLNNYYDAEDMILEVKTINDYGFTSLKKPKPEHVKQASIYGHLQPTPFKRIAFLYYNKNTSATKVMVADVQKSYVEMFMETAREVVNEYNSNMRRTRSKDLSTHSLFPRVCANRTNDRAMQCPYSDLCFKLQN